MTTNGQRGASDQRILTQSDAIREATDQAMEQSQDVYVMGLGVDDPDPVYGTTDLVDKYGTDRIVDTPLSEDAMTGTAIGAAMAGMRPIHVHIRMDFMLLTMNQLVNIAAKARYMWGGQVEVPMVVRGVIGRSWGQGAQHSQALHPFFMHVPGLKVVAPSTPYDSKGLLTTSIWDDNPVVFIEHRMLHKREGHVPEEPYRVPFGQARVLEPGDDVTIVAISHMALESLRAREELDDVDVSAEVIDPVSLSPLDMDTIFESLRKTGRLLVVDHAWPSCGAASEIVTRTLEALDNPGAIRFERMTFADVPCPTTHKLEDLFYPDAKSIAQRAFDLVHDGERSWEPPKVEAPEITQFRGPF